MTPPSRSTRATSGRSSNRAAIYADMRAYERALEDTIASSLSSLTRPLDMSRAGSLMRAVATSNMRSAISTRRSLSTRSRLSRCFNWGRVFFSKGDIDRAIPTTAPPSTWARNTRVRSRAAASPISAKARSTEPSPTTTLRKSSTGTRHGALWARHCQAEKGDASGADDIAAAKKIKPDIASVFDQSGVK